MPNQPKTPLRNVRVDDQLWTAALVKARNEGHTLSKVIRDLLHQYITKPPATR